MSNTTLKNTTIFVIGGSSGIGRGIADVLAQAKARVVVFSRTPPAPPDGKFADDTTLEWRHLDLAKPRQSRMQLAEALTEFGCQLDAVFYSAIYYGAKRQPFLDVSEDEWRQQIDVNLHGLWLSLSLTLPVLKKRSPSLFVHLSSEVVYNAGPGRSGYAATKAAASNLMRSIAQEYAKKEVRLVELLPQKMVDTPGIRQRRPKAFDYQDYMVPQHFQKAALELVRTRGKNKHGESWVVNEAGKMQPINEVTLPSQSQQK